MIVLDTNAWIRWVAAPELLSVRARAAIEREEPRRGLGVSAISGWEIALKARKGKLELGGDVEAWIARAAAYPGIVIHDVGLAEAVTSTALPGRLHDDPADRLIVALARRLRAPLVTSDRALLRYPHLETIW